MTTSIHGFIHFTLASWAGSEGSKALGPNNEMKTHESRTIFGVSSPFTIVSEVYWFYIMILWHKNREVEQNEEEKKLGTI